MALLVLNVYVALLDDVPQLAEPFNNTICMLHLLPIGLDTTYYIITCEILPQLCRRKELEMRVAREAVRNCDQHCQTDRETSRTFRSKIGLIPVGSIR